MDLSAWAYVAVALGAAAAGAVNALAGGGTLISFPVMTALGVPAVEANATNTVALCPGYLGGAIAQREELRDTGPEVRARLIVAAVSGLAGAILLVVTSEAVFREIVPYLILLACALLATQNVLRRWLAGRRRSDRRTLELAGVAAASVYGGYFGAGLGIMLLAILGLFSPLSLDRLNAVKQVLALAVNVSAAAFLAVSGAARWDLVAVMAPASLIGGNLGGRLVRVIPAAVLRPVIVTLGVAVAVVYLVR